MRFANSPITKGSEKSCAGAPAPGFSGGVRMTFGTSETLTGLFCWEATFGLALLLMDESHFCILNMEEVDEDMLGSMVIVAGKRLAQSVLAVETITALAEPAPM